MLERRAILRRMCWIGGAVSLSGCGSILYPERVRSHHSRDIDWKVAALDGLGLMLFFVPGVVAFVVDFYTGAIYLPPERTISYRPPSDSPVETALHRIEVPRSELNQTRIEETVASNTGHAVSLSDDTARASHLEDLEHYDQQLRHHHDDTEFGMAAKRFFHSVGELLKS